MKQCIFCGQRFEGYEAGCQRCLSQKARERSSQLKKSLSDLVKAQANAAITTCAPLWNRFLAFLIDFTIINFIIGRLDYVCNKDSPAYFPYVILIWFSYFTLSEILFRKTLGKLWLGLEVRAVDGRPASVPAIVFRNLTRVLPLILGVGLELAEQLMDLRAGALYSGYVLKYGLAFIAVSLTISNLKQGLHDLVAGTFVVEFEEPVKRAKDCAVALLVVLYLWPFLKIFVSRF